MQWINGEWRAGNGPEFTSENPATGEVIWTGKSASAEDVHQAISSAQQALKSWRKLSIEERSGHLDRFRALLEENSSVLTQAISDEVGKPLWDARTEVQGMISKVAVSLNALEERRSPRQVQLGSASGWTRYRPHGVMAVLGPYNFPGHIANGQIVPALAAGNTVVFKPSELTPLVAELTMQLWEKAELPPGVLNLVQGGKETGEALVDHAEINGVLFTGSVPTGLTLRQKLATRPEVILALELGGNNPLVIHELDHIPAAVHWTIQSAYLSSGQRCTCARRLILVGNQSTYLEALKKEISNISIGLPQDRPEPWMGPLIHSRAVQQVLEEQQRLLQHGAESLVEATPLELSPAFVSPGLIDVTHCKEVRDEEIFGPLLKVTQVETLEEAIQEANRTKYGLVASLFSSSREAFDLFYDEVQAGLINWNRPTTGASGLLPFGGVKQSGNHRPAGYFAVDFCNIPVGSLEHSSLPSPEE